ncbi:MAG TPA: phage tail protein [Phototrophicaceae bacterium]|nr:phage tail protein [Phototrophicaceae bacterium]
MPARPTDPLVGFSFGLDLSGKAAGYFLEVNGLGSESDVTEHKVTDPTGHGLIQKIPGRLKWTDVTLKRGVTAQMDLWQWRAAVEKGDMTNARVNCTITMYDAAYTPVAKWNLANAWPTKISGPTGNSDNSSLAVEEVTITFESMERVQ